MSGDEEGNHDGTEPTGMKGVGDEGDGGEDKHGGHKKKQSRIFYFCNFSASDTNKRGQLPRVLGPALANMNNRISELHAVNENDCLDHHFKHKHHTRTQDSFSPVKNNWSVQNSSQEQESQ